MNPILGQSRAQYGKSVYVVVVWSCLLFGLFACCFLMFGPERVLIFAVWAGGGGRGVRGWMPFFFFCFAVWAGDVFVFWCFLFCCLGGGAFFCCFFCCLGSGIVFLFFFFLFGRVAFVFLLVGRGTGVHSLTGLPGCLQVTQQQKRPNSKHKKNGLHTVLGTAKDLAGISRLY